MNPIRIVLLLVLVTLSLTLAGCNEATNNIEPEKYLVLEISKPDTEGKKYTTYRKIKDAALATDIKFILRQADESNAQASMSRNPDRKITIINTSPGASAEPQVYGIWYSTNPIFAEVVAETGGGGYVKLDPEDSNKVFDVL